MTNHWNSARKILVDQLYLSYGVRGPINRTLRNSRTHLNSGLWIFTTRGTKALKRAMDVVVALTALSVLCPLFLVVVILIYLEDGSPVLFWQTRVGLWGKEFRCPKFRSMVVNAEQLRLQLQSMNHHGDGITFKMKRDPRITKVGSIIRKLSIDELPQFWCVLLGDMSLVGPRPSLSREVARYALPDRRRLDAKPGLTCIWQVSGRGDLPFEQQVRLDEQYIESQSLLLDISLLLKTIPAILSGRGAY